MKEIWLNFGNIQNANYNGLKTRSSFFNNACFWMVFNIFVASWRWRIHSHLNLFKTTNIQILSPSLLYIWDMCYEISRLTLTDIEKNQTYRLDKFCEIHLRHLKKIRKRLIEFQSRIKKIVKASCRFEKLEVISLLLGFITIIARRLPDRHMFVTGTCFCVCHRTSTLIVPILKSS